MIDVVDVLQIRIRGIRLRTRNESSCALNVPLYGRDHSSTKPPSRMTPAIRCRAWTMPFAVTFVGVDCCVCGRVAGGVRVRGGGAGLSRSSVPSRERKHQSAPAGLEFQIFVLCKYVSSSSTRLSPKSMPREIQQAFCL